MFDLSVCSWVLHIRYTLFTTDFFSYVKNRTRSNKHRFFRNNAHTWNILNLQLVFYGLFHHFRHFLNLNRLILADPYFLNRSKVFFVFLLPLTHIRICLHHLLFFHCKLILLFFLKWLILIHTFEYDFNINVLNVIFHFV